MDKNVINAYVCSEGHTLITKNVDAGNTPHTMTCRHCADASVWRQVAYYQGDVDQNQAHTHEWYAPAHPERIADPLTRQHCLNGGLLLRKVGEGDYSEDLKVYTPSKANTERLAKGVIDALNNEPFVCLGCGHELDKSMSLRTEGYCYMCDPNISVDELLAPEPIDRNYHLASSITVEESDLNCQYFKVGKYFSTFFVSLCCI